MANSAIEWNKINVLSAAIVLASFCFVIGVHILRSYDEEQVYENVIGFKGLAICYSFHFFGAIASLVLNSFGYLSTLLLGYSITTVGTQVVNLMLSDVSKSFYFAILSGIGLSTANLLTYTFIGYSFDQYRPFMNNLMSSLMASVSFPVLVTLQRLTDGGLLPRTLYSMFYTVVAHPIMFLLLNLPLCFPDMHNICFGMTSRKLLPTKLFKDSAFVLFVIVCGLNYEVSYLVDREVSQMACSVGLSQIETKTLLYYTGLSTIGVSLISGVCYSRDTLFGFTMNRFHFLSMFLSAQYLACALLATVAHTHYVVLICVYIFYSFTVGCIGALPITILAELFGADSLVSCLGIRSIVVGFFAVVNRIVENLSIEDYFDDYWAPTEAIYHLKLIFFCCCSFTCVVLLDRVFVLTLCGNRKSVLKQHQSSHTVHASRRRQMKRKIKMFKEY